MDKPRLQITGRLRSIMRYDKLTGEVPRILIMRSQYWLDGACESAAKSLGWQVVSVPIPMEGALAREQIAILLDAVVNTRPDFILSINLAGMDLDGIWSNFFNDLQVPYVSWFVDDPRTILMERTTYSLPNVLLLTWEEAYVPYLRVLGFPHIHWLPLAADTSLFNAAPAEDPDLPPSFVGNSMEDFADRAWKPVKSNAALQSIADSAFQSGAVTRERFGTGLADMIGFDTHAQLDAEQRRALEMLFFIEGTRRYRRASVEGLLDLGIRVHGDEEWRRIIPRPQPAVPYFDALPGFYRQSAVNLNFTSIQMPGAVNQRVFDCPAAGGFLLTDAQSDLNRLFEPGVETATFQNIEECREKLAYYRDNPSIRISMIEKARARILAEHTYVHRLRSIARYVMQYFG